MALECTEKISRGIKQVVRLETEAGQGQPGGPKGRMGARGAQLVHTFSRKAWMPSGEELVNFPVTVA